MINMWAAVLVEHDWRQTAERDPDMVAPEDDRKEV
jgi:hypothetical protein